MSEMLDTFGVPEFFATTTRIENAGGGCIRIWNCIQRGNTVIPVSSVIFPASCILKLAESAQEFARRIAMIELDGGTAH